MVRLLRVAIIGGVLGGVWWIVARWWRSTAELPDSSATPWPPVPLPPGGSLSASDELTADGRSASGGSAASGRSSASGRSPAAGLAPSAGSAAPVPSAGRPSGAGRLPVASAAGATPAEASTLRSEPAAGVSAPLDGGTPESAPVDAPTPSATAWLPPLADGSCPDGFPVKAKERSRLYHLPGMFAYARTTADRCYREAEAAEADGFTRAKR